VEQNTSSIFGLGLSGAIGILFVQTSTVTVANTTTESTLVGDGVGTVSLARNFFATGTTLRLRAAGVFTTKAAPVGTLRLKVKKGSTVLMDTGVVTPLTDVDGGGWVIRSLISARSSTLVIDNGVFENSLDVKFMLNLSEVTINTTVEDFDLTVQWGTADVANSLSCTNLTLEKLVMPV